MNLDHTKSYAHPQLRSDLLPASIAAVEGEVVDVCEIVFSTLRGPSALGAYPVWLVSRESA